MNGPYQSMTGPFVQQNTTTVLPTKHTITGYNNSSGNLSVNLDLNETFNDLNSGSGKGAVPEAPVYLLVFATLFYVVIFIVGILGNAAVIAVVIYGRSIRNAVNIYLINLCVADLLVMVVCMPPVLVELHTKEVWYFGEVMCKTVPFLEMVVASASVFTIIAISVERYKVVCKPLSVTVENVLYVAKVIVVIWLTAIFISAPILSIVTYKDSSLLDGTPIKVCRVPVRTTIQKSYIVISTFFIYVIPCALLFTLYCRLCRKLIPDSECPFDMYERYVSEKLRLRKQVVNIIATIVSMFFICHLPYRAVSLWLIFESSRNVASLGLEKYLAIVYTARIFLYVNHALNPIVYNFVSRKFRRTFKMMVYFRGRRNRNNSSQRRVVERKSRESSGMYCKGEINLIRIELQHRQASSSSSSSSNRRRINDFCPLYKNIANSKEYDHLKNPQN
ncbi:pyrokinin-1 receptor-like [Mizuhopecten yessoensis]|uniref:Galanin receptor type 2 n=1 Tax=Mizuhopecten yessoensis TaxID=6573 RepID=A0A210QJ58_MIZYE|nr:pyrokinin-1 receptor-like [Mizuhopecten yessoensis]OWF48804.1 Galanin receptor type 2 [Mizuhopecten yessoensis]